MVHDLGKFREDSKSRVKVEKTDGIGVFEELERISGNEGIREAHSLGDQSGYIGVFLVLKILIKHQKVSGFYLEHDA